MVLKDDIRRTFKDLSSVDRIEILCGMLQLCHPYELRFIGTCLEDIAQKSFHSLVEFENIANQKSKLQDAIFGKESFSSKFFAALNIYLSLLHSDNITCAMLLFSVLNELKHSVLDKLEQSEDGSDIDIFDKNSEFVNDVVLLFTMAYYHPAFTLDQRLQMYGVSKSIKESLKQKQNNYVESAEVEFTSEEYALLQSISVKDFKFNRVDNCFIFNLEIKWTDGKTNDTYKSSKQLKKFCSELVNSFGNGHHVPPFPNDLAQISNKSVIEEMNAYFSHVLSLYNSVDLELVQDFFKDMNIIDKESESSVPNLHSFNHVPNPTLEAFTPPSSTFLPYPATGSHIERHFDNEQLLKSSKYNMNGGQLNQGFVELSYTSAESLYSSVLRPQKPIDSHSSMEATPFFLQSMEIQQHLQTISSIALVTTSLTNSGTVPIHTSINYPTHLHLGLEVNDSGEKEQGALYPADIYDVERFKRHSRKSNEINIKLAEIGETLEIDKHNSTEDMIANISSFPEALPVSKATEKQELNAETKIIYCTLADPTLNSVTSSITENKYLSHSSFTNNNYMKVCNTSIDSFPNNHIENDRTKEFHISTIPAIKSIFNHSIDNLEKLSKKTEHNDSIIYSDIPPKDSTTKDASTVSLVSNKKNVHKKGSFHSGPALVGIRRPMIENQNQSKSIDRFVTQPTIALASSASNLLDQQLIKNFNGPLLQSGHFNTVSQKSESELETSNNNEPPSTSSLWNPVLSTVNNIIHITSSTLLSEAEITNTFSSGDNADLKLLSSISLQEQTQPSNVSFLPAEESISYDLMHSIGGGGDINNQNITISSKTKHSRPILGAWQKKTAGSSPEENGAKTSLNNLISDDNTLQSATLREMDEGENEYLQMAYVPHMSQVPPLPPYPSFSNLHQRAPFHPYLPPIAIMDNSNFPHPNISFPCTCNICMQNMAPSMVWQQNLMRGPTSNQFVPTTRFPPPPNMRFINPSFDFPPFGAHMMPPPQMMAVNGGPMVSVCMPPVPFSSSSQLTSNPESNTIADRPPVNTKPYCYNCGAYGHAADACSDPFMLAMGQPAQFKLNTFQKKE